jgi:hypothetical protein
VGLGNDDSSFFAHLMLKSAPGVSVGLFLSVRGTAGETAWMRTPKTDIPGLF